jgi:hypothetical protein
MLRPTLALARALSSCEYGIRFFPSFASIPSGFASAGFSASAAGFSAGAFASSAGTSAFASGFSSGLASDGAPSFFSSGGTKRSTVNCSVPDSIARPCVRWPALDLLDVRGHFVRVLEVVLQVFCCCAHCRFLHLSHWMRKDLALIAGETITARLLLRRRTPTNTTAPVPDAMAVVVANPVPAAPL